ncbi:hypothetical protein [Sphingomonas canadensis]
MTVLAGCLAVMTAGCSGGAPANNAAETNMAEAANTVAAAAPVAADESCPDDGPRLPITKICAGRAVNYLNIAGEPLAAPDGCEWNVKELQFATDVLLYRALKCEGSDTTLEYAGGARKADLTYGPAKAGEEPLIAVEVFSAGDKADPTSALLANTRMSIENAGDRAKCVVRKDTREGMPQDAVVVDLTPAEAAKLPKDQPRYNCGPYGFQEEGSMSFWRVFQGFSWFFHMGTDVWSIDPGSFTLMTKDEKGEWVQAAE